jgi:hypothetical protein
VKACSKKVYEHGPGVDCLNLKGNLGIRQYGEQPLKCRVIKTESIDRVESLIELSVVTQI